VSAHSGRHGSACALAPKGEGAFALRFPDLLLAAVRSTVAVGLVAVGLLQELLVLALQIVLEDDAPDVEVAVLIYRPKRLFKR
jgi:hypothetical protein